MKKTIKLTESELIKVIKRIINEGIGDKITQEGSNSLKGQYTKKVASFLNNHYKMNLSAASTGNWSDKDFNDALLKYFKENKIQYGVCKKGDGYCHDEDEGQVYTNDTNFVSMIKNFDPSKPSQTTSSDKINNTHDRSYDYKLSNGKYYYSLKGKNNWIEAKGKGLEAIKTKVKF